jgi:hydrogenase maturation factor
VRETLRSLQNRAREYGLVLCGGHTEITDAVTRPVVSAFVAGTVARSKLIDKRSMRAGDIVLLTKRLAIEGTAVLARNFPQVLCRRGVPPGEIARCQNLLNDPGISIVREAKIAANFRAVSGMHDVTEGGVAAALEELSSAGGHKLRIHKHLIPIRRETRLLARKLDLDPLGLIGSGTLLVACRPQAVTYLKRAIERQGIEATIIGEVLDKGFGIEAVSRGGRKARWPKFQVDELARIFVQLEKEERRRKGSGPPSG